MKITHELAPLPYASDAFIPIITPECFAYHYGKHHSLYVSNLAKLIRQSAYKAMQVDQIIIESYKNKDFAVFNNAAQHWNHSFFWHCLTTDSKGFPTGKIKELINRDFKHFASFKQLFTQKAISFFGSGWLWLVVDHSGSLQLMELKDAQNPLIYNKKPLLALDLWEHAYYIDYRNARDKFIEGFWSIVNWEFANENLR